MHVNDNKKLIKFIMNDDIIDAFNDKIYFIKENLLADLNKSFFLIYPFFFKSFVSNLIVT